MIYKNKQETELIYKGSLKITSVYKGLHLVWEEIRSCFGKGFWINFRPWINTYAWKN